MIEHTTPLSRLTQVERAAAVRPFVGRTCTVVYRGGNYSDYSREITGHVIGASWHSTNGNSTGDLVMVPSRPGRVWEIRDAVWQAQSIALAHVGSITEVTS